LFNSVKKIFLAVCVSVIGPNPLLLEFPPNESKIFPPTLLAAYLALYKSYFEGSLSRAEGLCVFTSISTEKNIK